MILFVRYRNHFPVVRFQNQAHIWNHHGTGHDWVNYADAPTGAPRRPNYGVPMAPQIILFHSFTAAVGGGFPNGHRRYPNGGAGGAHRWRHLRHAPAGGGKSCPRREFSSIYYNNEGIYTYNLYLYRSIVYTTTLYKFLL